MKTYIIALLSCLFVVILVGGYSLINSKKSIEVTLDKNTYKNQTEQIEQEVTYIAPINNTIINETFIIKKHHSGSSRHNIPIDNIDNECIEEISPSVTLVRTGCIYNKVK